MSVRDFRLALVSPNEKATPWVDLFCNLTSGSETQDDVAKANSPGILGVDFYSSSHVGERLSAPVTVHSLLYSRCRTAPSGEISHELSLPKR